MTEVTNEDWGKIHAKAWKDPEFRKKLESDPTAAIHQYGKENGKTFTKLVRTPEKPHGADEAHLHKAHDYPVACC
jgi:hypothetical protein